jgi:hypothetical protein
MQQRVIAQSTALWGICLAPQTDLRPSLKAD